MDGDASKKTNEHVQTTRQTKRARPGCASLAAQLGVLVAAAPIGQGEME